MLDDKKIPDDTEVLEIITRFCNGGFGSDEINTQMMQYIERAYPIGISDMIFWDTRDLTPKQILEEAKKLKPICLRVGTDRAELVGLTHLHFDEVLNGF